MTLLVLDRGQGQLPPYLEWLEEPSDAVLFTGRSPDEIEGCQVRGYAEVRCFPRYASSGQVELAAVRLARDTPIRAIVAVAPEDAIRAGALRDHLGVDGQRRQDAIAQQDLVALRARLHEAGIPALRCGAVQRVCDLYWYGHHWGYPLRVRHRRRPGWPPAARLDGDADVAAFTGGGLTGRLETVPSLLIEPADDSRERITLSCPAGGPSPMPSASPPVARSLAVAALARLTRPGEGAWRVELVRSGTGHDWRVDAAGRALGSEATLARAQARLGRREQEPDAWAYRAGKPARHSSGGLEQDKED
jgi:hypothetical protein